MGSRAQMFIKICVANGRVDSIPRFGRYVTGSDIICGDRSAPGVGIQLRPRAICTRITTLGSDGITPNLAGIFLPDSRYYYPISSR